MDALLEGQSFESAQPGYAIGFMTTVSLALGVSIGSLRDTQRPECKGNGNNISASISRHSDFRSGRTSRSLQDEMLIATITGQFSVYRISEWQIA